MPLPTTPPHYTLGPRWRLPLASFTAEHRRNWSGVVEMGLSAARNFSSRHDVGCARRTGRNDRARWTLRRAVSNLGLPRDWQRCRNRPMMHFDLQAQA